MERKLQSLRTIELGAPVDTRRELMRRLSDAVAADYSGFMRFTADGDVVRYQMFDMVGSPDLDAQFRTLVGRPTMESTFDPANPAPADVNRFRTLDESPFTDEERDRKPLWRDYYQPFEVTDQLRALVFDRDRLVAWVAMGKRGGERFDPGWAAFLNRSFGVVRNACLAIDALERSIPEAGAYLVCDPRGRVRFSSNGAADAVRHVLDEISAAVRVFDRDERASVTYAIGPFLVSLVRLVDRRGSRYMAMVEPAPAPKLPIETLLTARQLEVAKWLATDATVDQVAAELGVSADGVKYFVTTIYRRLGISSRIELRRELLRSGLVQ